MSASQWILQKTQMTDDRRSPSEVFLGKGILEMCSRFTGEHQCRSVISIKLQSNFVEIILRHGCSPVNLLHIFRTPFCKNTSGLLLRWLRTYLGPCQHPWWSSLQNQLRIFGSKSFVIDVLQNPKYIVILSNNTARKGNHFIFWKMMSLEKFWIETCRNCYHDYSKYKIFLLFKFFSVGDCFFKL